MASTAISVIVIIATSLACIFAEPPVQIDERHLRGLESQEDQDAENGWQDSVPGLPGHDYPNLTSIPETSFTCAGKTPGGYYADVETRCQVFHVCSTQGSKSSFLCPSGSIFNQRHFVCDWWYDFECEQAVELYALNKALDDPRFSTDRVKNDDRYSQPISPPLQFNSLGGPNGDLSLASSGYPNNIRDEANLIYEDYTNGKIHDASSVASPSTEKPAPSGSQQLGSSGAASGISSADNYSEARQKEATFDSPGHFNGLEQQQQAHYQRENEARARNYENARQTYRRRPSQGPDNVPRGFSKDRSEEMKHERERELKRNDQGPGSFINNGLSEELEKNQNYPLPRENNNYIDTNKHNNHVNNVENKNYNLNNNINNVENKNYNLNNNINNVENKNYNLNSNINNVENKNYNTNNKVHNAENRNYQFNSKVANENSNFNYDNTKYEHFYQISVNKPHPQENNSYVNNNNNHDINKNINNINNVNNNNNHDNSNNINNIHNVNNNNQNNNNYYSKNSISSSDQYNNNNNQYSTSNNYYNANNNIQYENHYQHATTIDSSSTSNFNPETNYQQKPEEPTSNPRSTYPTEDDVDRERQREVDSADLKRQRPQSRQYDYPSTPFLIREESTITTWRDDLSTSSSGSQSPPYPPERSYVSPETPTLSKPEESTTPVADAGKQRARERPKFLGRRPAGGLPGGPGNGLPGANKVLVGSDGITGKPGDDTGANKIPQADAAGAGGNGYRNDEAYPAQQNFNGNGGELAGNGQYWHGNGQAWNNGGGYEGRY